MGSRRRRRWKEERKRMRKRREGREEIKQKGEEAATRCVAFVVDIKHRVYEIRITRQGSFEVGKERGARRPQRDSWWPLRKSLVIERKPKVSFQRPLGSDEDYG